MRRIVLFTLAATLVMAALFSAGCGKNPVGPESQLTSTKVASDSVTYLNFANPMTMAEVGQYVRQNHLEVLEVRLQRPGYVAGFRLDGQTPEQAAVTFAQEHRKFLMLISTRTEPEMASQRAAAQSELSRLSSTTLRVSAMTVAGSSGSYRQLPNATVAKGPLSVDNPGPAIDPTTIQQQVQPNSLYHQSWAPYGGTSEVNKSYSYQRFIFNNLSMLNIYWSSYEHETLISDKNYANQTGYWASNMPNAYLDCGNGGDSVDNFAVGTFTASLMRTYTWYFTYIGLTGQSASSSLVKIWAERGTTVSWSCWATFKAEHAGPLATMYTGGGMSWQF